MRRRISLLPRLLLLIAPMSAYAQNGVAITCMCLGLFESGGKRTQQPLLTRTPLVNGARISSGFGLRIHPIFGYLAMHFGWDISVPLGTPVTAVLDGIVQFSGGNGGYGNFILISHANALATAYGHLDQISPGIRTGARVKAGQVIGLVGSTGLSTGPHLHLECRVRGVPVNPAILFCSQPIKPSATETIVPRNNARKAAPPKTVRTKRKSKEAL